MSASIVLASNGPPPQELCQWTPPTIAANLSQLLVVEFDENVRADRRAEGLRGSDESAASVDVTDA